MVKNAHALRYTKLKLSYLELEHTAGSGMSCKKYQQIQGDRKYQATFRKRKLKWKSEN